MDRNMINSILESDGFEKSDFRWDGNKVIFNSSRAAQRAAGLVPKDMVVTVRGNSLEVSDCDYSPSEEIFDAKTDYVFNWRDTYHGTREKTTVSADSIGSAIKKFGDLIALGGVGTYNAYVISVSPNDGYVTLYGRLSDLLKKNFGDAIEYGYIGNAKVVKSLPKVGTPHEFENMYGKVAKIDFVKKSNESDGTYSIYRVWYKEPESGDLAYFSYAIKDSDCGTFDSDVEYEMEISKSGGTEEREEASRIEDALVELSASDKAKIESFMRSQGYVVVRSGKTWSGRTHFELKPKAVFGKSEIMQKVDAIEDFIEKLGYPATFNANELSVVFDVDLKSVSDSVKKDFLVKDVAAGRSFLVAASDSFEAVLKVVNVRRKH